MMSETTLAAANVKIVHDKAQNMKRFVELIEEAAEKDVDVLVLPEMGLQGYADFALPMGSPPAVEQKQYYYREAETIPGPATEQIGALAGRHAFMRSAFGRHAPGQASARLWWAAAEASPELDVETRRVRRCD